MKKSINKIRSDIYKKLRCEMKTVVIEIKIQQALSWVKPPLTFASLGTVHCEVSRLEIGRAHV